MGLMDMLHRYMEKRRVRKEKLKVLEEDMRIQKMAEDKLKSANERELERFEKEGKEEWIKKRLEMYRKRKKKEAWSSPNFQKGASILKNDHPILRSDHSIFDKPMHSAMLHGGESSILKQDRQFWRW